MSLICLCNVKQISLNKKLRSRQINSFPLTPDVALSFTTEAISVKSKTVKNSIFAYVQ